MFQYHHLAAPLIMSVMAAASGNAQDAFANDVLAPQGGLSGMSVSIINTVQRGTLLGATLRIDNATGHDLVFRVGAKDPAWLSLHAGDVVVPGTSVVENASSDSDWPAETPIDDQIHISPEGSRTVQVTFRLIDPQEDRCGFRFIEVTGSHADHAIHTSVPLVISPTHDRTNGYPWEGGG